LGPVERLPAVEAVLNEQIRLDGTEDRESREDKKLPA